MEFEGLIHVPYAGYLCATRLQAVSPCLDLYRSPIYKNIARLCVSDKNTRPKGTFHTAENGKHATSIILYL